MDLCKGLHDRGHDVFVVLRPTNEWRERLDFLPKQNFFYASISNSLGIFSARKIAKFCRDNKIEIVHAHVARDYFPASLICLMAKTPKFVLTRHVLFPMKSFYRFSLRNLSKAIAVSKGVEAQLQKLFPQEKITIISNGTEIKHVSIEEKQLLRNAFRFEHNIPFDSFLIGTIGELKLLKGQLDFVLAAQIIAQKFPDARFAIIGKDNSLKQDFRRELKRMVKVFNLEDHFLWLDWVEDTASVFPALDVFVSASHSESFGLAILEAAASSTAIVSTATEGAKEILGIDKLVPVGNSKLLADEICMFLENEEKRIEFGQEIQNRVKESFSLEKMISETEKVYAGILKSDK